MKRNKFLFTLMLFMLTLSCSVKEESLLDRTGYNQLGNRDYDKYTTGSRIWGFSIGDGATLGFGGGFIFLTVNDFESTEDERGALLPDYRLTYLTFDSVSAWQSNNGNFSFYVSRHSIDPYTFVGSLSGSVSGAGYTGNYINWDFSNINIRQGYLGADYLPLTGTDIKPASIDLYWVNHGRFNYVNSLPTGYALADIKAHSAARFWVMAHEIDGNGEVQLDKVVMFRTNDGGANFTTAIPVSNNNGNFTIFYKLNDNRLLAFNSTTLLRTNNAGDTWQRIDFPFAPTQSLHFLEYLDDARTLFAVVKKDEDEYGSISDLYRSLDAGDTWQKMNQHDFYADNVSFFNATIGVATSKNVLQITRDGGATWRVVIFPYRAQ